MPRAARRHFQAAEELMPGHRSDVAGYLFGIAAECAVKEMMSRAGMRPRPNEQRREDPFFAHFPELRTILRDELKGRAGMAIARLIEDDAFMNNWSTAMRYSSGRQVVQQWVEKWAEQARRAIVAMEG